MVLQRGDNPRLELVLAGLNLATYAFAAWALITTY
jgi:hypothetical protein